MEGAEVGFAPRADDAVELLSRQAVGPSVCNAVPVAKAKVNGAK